MSEPLLFTRSALGLVPADERSREAVKRIAMGSLVTVDLKQPRNGKRHRLFWKLMDTVHANLPEDKAALYPSVESLVDTIKVATGWRDEVRQVNGAVAFKPRSIAFGKMSDTEFTAFFDQVCHLLIKHFLPGVTEAELRNEVEEMLGLRVAA